MVVQGEAGWCGKQQLRARPGPWTSESLGSDLPHPYSYSHPRESLWSGYLRDEGRGGGGRAGHGEPSGARGSTFNVPLSEFNCNQQLPGNGTLEGPLNNNSSTPDIKCFVMIFPSGKTVDLILKEQERRGERIDWLGLPYQNITDWVI